MTFPIRQAHSHRTHTSFVTFGGGELENGTGPVCAAGNVVPETLRLLLSNDLRADWHRNARPQKPAKYEKPFRPGAVKNGSSAV